MSESERVEDADAESEAEKQEYQVLHTPIGDTQPGQTVELRPEVAEAFEDNVHPAGEEPPEDEGLQSQVLGQSNGPETLADQDEPIEEGEYEVYQTPIGDVEPGEVAHFEESIARAFADNLLPTDEDAEAAAEVAPQSEDDDEADFSSPEEFLDQTVAEVRDALEEADLTDDQLETLREHADRTGVQNAIDDQLED